MTVSGLTLSHFHIGERIFAGCQLMSNVPVNRSHSDVPDQVSVISVPCLTRSQIFISKFSFLWPRWWTHFGQLSDPALQIMNNVPGNRSHNDVPDQVSVISLRVSIVKSSVPCLGWGLTRSQSELRFKDFSFLWPRWWTHFGQLSDPASQIMNNEPLPDWHDNC